jgi:predicted DNA-binding protein
MPNKRDSFNLRMPPKLRNRLETLAEKRETTLTALILELIRQQLDTLGEKE